MKPRPEPGALLGPGKQVPRMLSSCRWNLINSKCSQNTDVFIANPHPRMFTIDLDGAWEREGETDIHVRGTH